MSPLHNHHRRTPLREDSVCKLLENSCDLISDDDDEEVIELLVEEGQVPILIQRKPQGQNKLESQDFFDEEDDESSLSQRDSYPLGAGCLPCTPKSSKKTPKPNWCQKHGGGKSTANWCCGVVAKTVKKTTKKL